MNFAKLLYIFVVPIIINSCSSSNDPLRDRTRQLVDGTLADDTSFVYRLPYPAHKSYRVIQGYFSSFSHRNRAALDFNFSCGDTICAARSGTVVRVKQDGTKGGWNKKYRSHGNNIVIEHDDGSRAGYWHLQHNGALVRKGDSVEAGQPIALSGKTGYAIVPHLHFLVWTNKNGNWQQLPTRFETSVGKTYLRTWKKYQPGTIMP